MNKHHRDAWGAIFILIGVIFFYLAIWYLFCSLVSIFWFIYMSVFTCCMSCIMYMDPLELDTDGCEPPCGFLEIEPGSQRSSLILSALSSPFNFILYLYLCSSFYFMAYAIQQTNKKIDVYHAFPGTQWLYQEVCPAPEYCVLGYPLMRGSSREGNDTTASMLTLVRVPKKTPGWTAVQSWGGSRWEDMW